MFSELFCILKYLVARAPKAILGFFALWQELKFFIELFMFDDQKWAYFGPVIRKSYGGAERLSKMILFLMELENLFKT